MASEKCLICSKKKEKALPLTSEVMGKNLNTVIGQICQIQVRDASNQIICPECSTQILYTKSLIEYLEKALMVLQKEEVVPIVPQPIGQRRKSVGAISFKWGQPNCKTVSTQTVEGPNIRLEKLLEGTGYEFHCLDCNYRSARPAIFKMHLKRKHHIDNPKIYKCCECYESFCRVTHYDRHACHISGSQKKTKDKINSTVADSKLNDSANDTNVVDGSKPKSKKKQGENLTEIKTKKSNKVNGISPKAKDVGKKATKGEPLNESATANGSPKKSGNSGKRKRKETLTEDSKGEPLNESATANGSPKKSENSGKRKRKETLTEDSKGEPLNESATANGSPKKSENSGKRKRKETLTEDSKGASLNESKVAEKSPKKSKPLNKRKSKESLKESDIGESLHENEGINEKEFSLISTLNGTPVKGNQQKSKKHLSSTTIEEAHGKSSDNALRKKQKKKKNNEDESQSDSTPNIKEESVIASKVVSASDINISDRHNENLFDLKGKDDWEFKCDRCSFASVNSKEFKDHLLAEHEVQKAKIYKCPFCPKSFKRYNSLTEHIHDIHEGEF